MHPFDFTRLIWKYLRQSEKHSTANFEMQYPPPFAATRPSTEATLTIRPRALLTSGRKFMVVSITPVILTFRVLWKSSICIHSDGPMGNERPALFTIPHSPAIGKTETQINTLPRNNAANSDVTNWHISPVQCYMLGALTF